MFDWRQYLRLADELMERSEELEEASNRSAISRAYYAAFNLALERAAAIGLDVQPSDEECGNQHAACWRAFRAHSDKKLRAIGTLGRDLRDIRNRADYEANLPDHVRKAERAVDDARRLINQLYA
jgi:uncharacterized protein (UPF0332 family)